MRLLEKHLARLKGRTAWITGGRRLGRTVARLLAECGANVVVSYRCSAKEAQETAEEARKLGVRSLAVEADVASRESVAAAVERVRADFPEIDILINMASVYKLTAWRRSTSTRTSPSSTRAIRCSTWITWCARRISAT